jgi:hypothetical protein
VPAIGISLSIFSSCSIVSSLLSKKKADGLAEDSNVGSSSIAGDRKGVKKNFIIWNDKKGERIILDYYLKINNEEPYNRLPVKAMIDTGATICICLPKLIK